MDSVKKALKARGTLVANWLASCLEQKELPQGLRTAMEYSLLAGGKRVRPVLCLAAAGLFGLPAPKALPFAGALECIHTYSLIHDDLPAMDDDDLRRGRPSSHKQFDEATAILAGDALLTDAFAFMASVPDIPAERVLRALSEVALAAGSQGMVGGQFLDMQYTGMAGVTLDQLAAMHAMKTGALLTAPCVCGAILAGATPADVQKLRHYGQNLGVAFQIVDDILDETGTEEEIGKPVGSDRSAGKNTYPSLVGLEVSQAMARERVDLALEGLDGYDGDDADFLRDIALYMLVRVS